MREGARGLVGEEAGRATPEGDLAQLQHYSCSGSNSELREPRTLRLIKPQLQTAGFKGSPPGFAMGRLGRAIVHYPSTLYS